jgi:protein gp37
MADNTKIEWATHTFNPWMGCTAVSAACDFCYAEALIDKRYKKVKWGNHPRALTRDPNWKKPLLWARKAREERAAWLLEPSDEWYCPGFPGPTPPERPRVFCASLADVFDNQAPDVWRTRLWDLILETPELDWLLLTKRPQNIAKMIPINWRDAGLPAHIWLGITAENQTEYERRMRLVAETPAAVTFVSYEPALGEIDLTRTAYSPKWIICGGEDRQREGRPTNDEFLPWARKLRDQCQFRGISFFFKQTVGKGEIPADLQIRQFPHRA